MEFSSLSEIQRSLREKKISSSELFDFYKSRIEKYNPDWNAFLEWNNTSPKELKPGPLSGIPLGIKDLFCVKGMRTTAGSRLLESYIPPYTATAVKRLEEAGALILGKCNNDEFAMGSKGENSYFGAVKNPWNTARSAGGSSSGSACAVAGRLCPASIGTDTGGSVRLPAHYCHLVGVKPTYGRISRYGMIAYGSSLDQAGIFSLNVEDSALLLDLMCGADPLDSVTADKPPVCFQKKLNPDIKGKKVAYFDPEIFRENISDEVFYTLKTVLNLLKKRGCKLEKKPWPFFDYGVSVYYLISTAEASANLSRYDGLRYGRQSEKKAENLQEFYALNRSEGFGPEVRRRILMGTFCLSEGYYEDYFQKACRVRRLIQEAFNEILSSCQAIVCPTAGNSAPLLKEQKTELQTYLDDQFTVFANLAGIPALSLPAGFSSKGLPIGIQLMGGLFREQEILDLALALEQDLQVKEEKPHGI